MQAYHQYGVGSCPAV